MTAARLPLVLAACLLASPPGQADLVNYEMVTVGDPRNAADDTGYGAVDESFQIGKYEVTIAQYAQFLNAVAKSDPYDLFDWSMTSDNTGGITRSGSSGSYTYDVTGPSGIKPEGASSPGNRPISSVTWFDAARFANWMHNGQGSGSTETGAYTLDGVMFGNAPAVNPGAKFYIPTENQWYKAAYYKGGGPNAGYWDYATQSNSVPGNSIGSEPNQVNYRRAVGEDLLFSVTQDTAYSSFQNYLTDVGAFTSSQSAYGTYDQNGNIMEWNDLTGDVGLSRGVRGGSFNGILVFLPASSGMTITASNLGQIGFRLASPVAVPEPSTWVMGLAGVACGGYTMWRRRKRA